MHTRRQLAGLVVASTLALGAGNASAAIIFYDTFEGASATKLDDVSDPTDIAWYSAVSFGTATLVSDSFAGGGSTNALQLTSPDTFRRMSGNFASTAVGPAIGDKIRLSFDMRLAEAPTANQLGFRFGLFNANGTFTTGDNANGTSQPTAQNDDFGYRTAISTGSPATLSNDLIDEPAGDNPLGGGIGGTVFGTAGSPVSINNQTLHSMIFEIIRDSATTVQLKLTIDGVLKTTSSSDASPYTTFNTVYFGQGNVSTDFVVDNVLLENFVVPEPASLGLLGLGVVALLARRRR